MINLIGTILGSSGYDTHTRELLNALLKFTKVKLLTNIPPGAEINLTDRELLAFKDKSSYDINLIITHPLYWRLHTNNKRNWVYLVWEGDRIPKSFIDEILNPEVEYVIVPSEHTYNAVMNCKDIYYEFRDSLDIITDKLKVIPHGVNLEKFYPLEKPKDKFRFLANKGFRNMEDRGGVQYALEAFMSEFAPTENVEFLVKINPAYGIPDLNKIMSTLKEKYPTHAPIKFITENYKYEDLVKIYNQANCFISPTRAEAFNIPCLEAQACGLPVITTSFGGQTDFVDSENGWIIGGELTEVKHELQYEGIKWLTPSIPELRAMMRASFMAPLEDKGNNSINSAKRLTWDKCAESIINLSVHEKPVQKA